MTAIADMNEDELRRVVMQQSDAILALKAELQAARMPDEVEAIIRNACHALRVFSERIDESGRLDVVEEWLDSLTADRKDVTRG